MEAKAKLRLARISARKARLVADLIRGKEVDEALEILRFTRKKSAPLFKTLVESAVANAEHLAQQADEKLDIDQLYIKAVFARARPRDQDPQTDRTPHRRRRRPRNRGLIMGQKVHPIGFRVGIIRDWESKWYADKDYQRFLHEDLAIRKFLKEKLFHASISKVTIERA